MDLSCLGNDRYLRNIACMVLSYGLTIEFTELVWKAVVKKSFPFKTDYLAFTGKYSSLVGVAAFLMMMVGTRVVDSWGWEAGALITPVMMAALSVPFFIAILVNNRYPSSSALQAALYLGLLQNVFTKVGECGVVWCGVVW